ncbi:MAG: hypothetical protein JWN78_3359 [Bacteroidota bacterium]|nr:hypothetical protein [Bacteroidota bacterium]
MNKIFTLTATLLLLISGAFAQDNVGIGTSAPDVSAKLDINTSLDAATQKKGLLPPMISLASTTDGAPFAGLTTPGPATGLLVYNTNAAMTGVGASGVGFYYNSGTKASPVWKRFASNADAWLLLGNTGTAVPVVPATYGTSLIGASENFLGTLDNKDFVIGTSDIERLRVKSTGNVGIGTANPVNTLHVIGNSSIGSTTNSVTGTNSVGIGNGNTVSGNYSVIAGGQGNTISGQNDLVSGFNSRANFDHSIAVGFTDTADASATGAFGFGTRVTGFTGFATGDRNKVSGQNGFASGYNNNAKGDGSFVTGQNNTAASYTEAALGVNGTNYTPAATASFVATDRLLNVGNGTSTAARADAFTILKNGRVGINNSSPDGTSKLDITATDKGVLAPRVALTAINAAAPITKSDGTVAATTDLATSLLVYNTATAGVSPNNVIPGYYYWNGSAWVRIQAGNNNYWTLTGNPDIDIITPAAPATYGTSTFNATDNWIGTIGTTDDFTIGSANKERMRVTSAGNIGIGTATPTATALLTINPITNAIRNGIDMTLTNAAAAATGINITTGNSNVNGITVTHSASAATTYYGVGGKLTSGVGLANGYLGYHTGTGNTAANYFAGYFQGKTAITSDNSPTSISDLEIQNTTAGTTPVTLSMRPTVEQNTSGTNLAQLNFGDSRSTNPQAQIQAIRDATATAGAGSTDLPTALTFSTNTDNSAALTERVRIANTGNVGIATNGPNVKLDINGNYAYRDGGTLTLANGNNNDVIIPAAFSAFRIAGPTAVFAITGIAGGVNGQILTLVNSTANTMTIATSSGLSAAANQITIGSGNNYILTGQYSTITLQYNSVLTKWIVLAANNGNTELWVRPTGASYINDYYTTQARVYDAGQQFAYYYEGTNSNGSFFSGQNTGVCGARNGQASTDLPTFTFDTYPFTDAGGNNDITVADQVTYSGMYSYGGVYNGITGIGAADAGVRGIAMPLPGGSDGTNASWPVTGVLGESTGNYSGGGKYGTQGVYGWNTAANAGGQFSDGVYGRTAQTGYASAGVVGQYEPSQAGPGIGLLNSGLGAVRMYGALGYKGREAAVYGDNVADNGIAIGVRGYGYCLTGNPSYTYGGYFEAFGSQDSRAVYAEQGTGPLSNYAYYGLGNFYVSGAKSSGFLNKDKKPVLMYCTETPEVWFEDLGSASISNSKETYVKFPEDILEGIIVDEKHPFRVSITPTSDLGNYWVEKKTDGFILHTTNLISDGSFDWRISAKRKGYEDRRLDYAGADAAFDPYLIDPYSNHDNSKVDWKADIEMKKPAILKQMSERTLVHANINAGEKAPVFDKIKYEKEKALQRSNSISK